MRQRSDSMQDGWDCCWAVMLQHWFTLVLVGWNIEVALHYRLPSEMRACSVLPDNLWAIFRYQGKMVVQIYRKSWFCFNRDLVMHIAQTSGNRMGITVHDGNPQLQKLPIASRPRCYRNELLIFRLSSTDGFTDARVEGVKLNEMHWVVMMLG